MREKGFWISRFSFHKDRAAGLALAIPLLLVLLASATERLEGQPAPPPELQGDRTWVLLVNGDAASKHLLNVDRALRALEGLGIDRDRFWVVSVEPIVEPVHWYPAKGRNLRAALDGLAGEIAPGATLLVYLTGHGSRWLGRTGLVLESGSVSSRRLARQLGRLKWSLLILVADQCFGGGLAELMAQSGRTLISATATDARHRTSCQPFIRPFWKAFSDFGADRDGDGRVSVEEAYCTAAASLRRSLGSQGRAWFRSSAPVHPATPPGPDSSPRGAGRSVAVAGAKLERRGPCSDDR